MIANPHVIPAPLADGTLGVFVPASHMIASMTRLFGGPNRHKPISYDALYQEFEREAYPKSGPSVEKDANQPGNHAKAEEGPSID